MDEETRQYLAEIMVQINVGFDRILDLLETIREEMNSEKPTSNKDGV